MLDVYPEPEVPAWLKQARRELAKTGWAVEIFSPEWNLIWVSSELKNLLGEAGDVGYGEHILDLYRRDRWKNLLTARSSETMAEQLLPYVDGSAEDSPHFLTQEVELKEEGTKVKCVTTRIVADGEHVGQARLYGPALRASVLSVVAQGDTGQFEMMTRLREPGKRKAAIMFTDVESSTKLSRVLPSETYFNVLSETISQIDDSILRHRGLVGKHAGDGVTAFFVADEHSTESGAVRAAITSSREIHDIAMQVAQRKAEETGLEEILNLKIKIALHWGDSLYIGQISTRGRLDVTAIGEEVNDTARIESVAKGGQTLASKALIERLDARDSEHLEIEVAANRYQRLGDIGLDPKVEKDSVNVPICDIARITGK